MFGTVPSRAHRLHRLIAGSLGAFLIASLALFIPAPAYAADQAMTNPTLNVTGAVQVGSTLTAIASVTAPASPQVSYRWTVGGSEVSTSATFVPVAAQVGSTVSVTATFTKSGYITATASRALGAITSGTLANAAVTISGTPTVDLTLAAKVTSTPAATATYRWFRGSVLLGTGSTYIPTAADVGQKVKVEAVLSATGYTTKTITSAETAAVASGTFTGSSLSVRGGRTVGGYATAVVTYWPTDADVTYRWTRAGTVISTAAAHKMVSKDVGENLTVTAVLSHPGYTEQIFAARVVVKDSMFPALAVTMTGEAQVGKTLTASMTPQNPSPGTSSMKWYLGNTAVGTGATYTVAPADEGKAIYVMVTRQLAPEDPELFATAAKVIKPGTFSAVSSTITGTAQVGAALTASVTSTPDATQKTFEWYRGDTLLKKSNTFTPTADDLGKVLTLRTTVARAGYTDGLSTTSTAATAAGTFATPKVTISGTAQVGQVLTAAGTSTPTAAAVTYRWMRGTTNVGTGTTYTATAADIGSTLSVIGTFSGPGYTTVTAQAVTAATAAGVFASPKVTITGTAQVGKTLTATATSTPTAGTLTFQWKRGATNVGTGASYTPVPADLGAALTVVATFSSSGYTTVTAQAVTAATAAGVFASPKVTIAGTAQVGKTLTATATSTPTAGTVAFQWKRGTTLVASTAAYSPTAADLGATLTVESTFASPGFTTTTARAQTAVTVPAVFTDPKVTIAGTAQVGKVLTATATSTPTGTIAYQWKRGTTLVGTTASYTPVAADLGAPLTVEATFTKAGYTTVTAQAATAATVVGVFASPKVTITGSSQVGQTLTAAGTSSPTADSISYQWKRGTTNIGTGARYVLTADDVAKNVSVVATFTKAGHTTATATADSGTIATGGFNATSATIEGDATFGRTLTARTSSTPTADEVTVTWLRGGTTVGAGTSYKITAEDVGEKITLQADFTKVGYGATRTTDVSSTIAAAALTDVVLTISGKAKVGQELTAKASSAPAPDAVTYVWLRGGVEVGTGAAYTPDEEDEGKALTVTATLRRAGHLNVVTSKNTAVIATLKVPTLSLAASATNLVLGESATLTWATTHATSVKGSWSTDELVLDGSAALRPTTAGTHTWDVTATNENGTTSATVSVVVTQPVAPGTPGGTTPTSPGAAPAPGHITPIPAGVPVKGPSVAGRKTSFWIKGTKTVRFGKTAVLVVSGAAAGERVTIKIGKRRITRTADRLGRVVLRTKISKKMIKAPRKTKKVTISAAGSRGDRKGAMVLKVNPVKKKKKKK